jgi:hypothetical protein
MSNSKSLHENVFGVVELWKERVRSRVGSKEEWDELLSEVTQVIREITRTEENFSFKSFSEPSSSAESLQKILDTHMPSVKVRVRKTMHLR